VAAVAAALALSGCGEGTRPAREPVDLQMSRDSATLEIGDTVVLRAEARDVNGDPIADAPIAWATLNPGVASIVVRGASARFTAASAGTARVTASISTLADTAVLSIPPALIATTVSVHLDTLEALGDTLIVHASSQDPTGTRSGLYTATSRNPAVAQVSMTGAEAVVVAATPGQTYVTVTERLGTRDSALVVVRQREAITELTPPVAGGYVGRTQQVAAVVKDRRGTVIPGVAIAFRSFDTTIVTVSSTGLLTFVGPGTSALEARGAGGSADTSTVAVPQTARLILRSAAESIGTGLMSKIQWVSFSSSTGATPWVRLRVLDASVAGAPDSTLDANSSSFRIIGKNPGTTRLIASSDFAIPDTMSIVVTPSHLHLSAELDFPHTSPRLVSVGSQLRISVVGEDSLGRPGDPAGQVGVSIVSRDTTIAAVPQNQNPYILQPVENGIPLFPVVGVDTGRVWVVATAPGLRSDSLEFAVGSAPKLLFKRRAHIIGAGQRNIDADGAAIGSTQGWDHGAVAITFTRTRPAVAAFPDTMTLTVGALFLPLSYISRTPGVDTIVASAPGYEPDTTVLYVTTPHFLPTEDTVRGTTLGAYGAFDVGDSLGVRHKTDSAVLVFATPADTAIARTGAGRVPAEWGSGWTIAIPAVDTGSTTMTLTDSAGRYAPAEFAVRLELDSSYRIAVADPYELGPPSPRQRFDETRFALYIPPSPAPGRVAYLTSTNPRVVRAPDSVVVQGTGFNRLPLVVAGDSVGSARLIVSAPGFKTDTSAPVVVGPGRLNLIAPESVYVDYTGYTVRGTAWTGGCFSMMPLDTAATFTLVPLDAGIVVDTSLTIATGQICSPTTPITFTTPGHLRLALEDHRSVPVRYRGDTATIVVRRPRVVFQYPYPPNVGVGQRLVATIRRDGNGQDAVSLTVTHSSAHASVTPPTGMSQGQFQSAAWVDGVTVGRDTVMVTAPGYDGDTLPVIVTEGRISVYHWPTQIQQGDSVLVALFVGDSTGLQHPVVDSTTFAIVKEGGISVRQTNQTVTTVTVPRGQDASGIFYIKAVGPTGTARVRFVNLHYSDQVFTLTVTP
jgi:hypothetical protein